MRRIPILWPVCPHGSREFARTRSRYVTDLIYAEAKAELASMRSSSAPPILPDGGSCNSPSSYIVTLLFYDSPQSRGRVVSL